MKSDISIFWKTVEKIKVSLKSDKNNGYCIWRQIFLAYLAQMFLEWKMCQTFTGNQNTHLCSITFFFRKSCRLWHNVEKYCSAGKATDDKMAQAHCVQNTYVYKHTHWICNTDCFSSATMAARTRLNVTLFAHCLSCFHILITARLADKKLHWSTHKMYP
jgi:hypothetical protein